jgi:hypothetical protein
VEDMVRAAQQPKKRTETRKTETNTTANIQNMEEKLRHALGTKVKVRTKGQ